MSHDNWETPRDFFEVADYEFEFRLDAAAEVDNTKCKNFYTAEDDALRQPWDYSSVWCNPPYSLMMPFIKRGYEQHLEHRNTVVMLLPAYTDPRYWSEYVMKAHEVRFLKGRLQFLENGSKKQSARFPSVLVVFKWIKGQKFGYAPHQWVWDWRA